MAVPHLFHIPAIKILHGFQCLVAVGYEAEEQASFRRLNPDQKVNSMSQKKSLNDTRRLRCSVQQESSEISAHVWPSSMKGPV